MKALLVSYHFPPVSSAGVFRTLKLAKYLPDHGVTPAILTAANPSVPSTDDSLLRDVADTLEILRARTMEPGYGVKQAVWQSSAANPDPGLLRRLKSAAAGLARSALVPDPQLLWLPDASRVLAARLASRRADDVVFITAPPFSQFLLAPLARMRPGTAVVLDYRDEWITYRSSYEMMGRLGGWVGGPMERSLVRAAHVITTATEAFRDNLLSQFPALDPGRVVAIPNGYDPDDFPTERPEPPSDRFVITYAGTVFKLTSPRGFLDALRILHQREPRLAGLLDVRFIGRVVPTEEEIFEGCEQLGVRRLGFMDKRAVMREQAASHLVLCTLDEVEGNQRIYPGKIFELMHLRRPCLTLAPPGALAELVERHRLGPVLPPRDTEAIADYLAGQLRAFEGSRRAPQIEPIDIDRYHRRAQAGEFKDAFARALELARGRVT